MNEIVFSTGDDNYTNFLIKRIAKISNEFEVLKLLVLNDGKISNSLDNDDNENPSLKLCVFLQIIG